MTQGLYLIHDPLPTMFIVFTVIGIFSTQIGSP